jgi:predicted nucleotidyltransferase
VTNYIQLLKRLIDHDVEFIVIGGVAAALQGSGLATFDLDVCAPMTDANIDRIHAAMQDLNAYFGQRPDRLPLYDDPKRLHGFKNIYLRTNLGAIDLLGELPGVASYEEILKNAEIFEVENIRFKVIDLETLLAAKRVAGRDKDKTAIRQLEAAKQRRHQQRIEEEPDPGSR